MKKLKIGKSDIHGKGLFTGEPIRKGDLIAKVHSGIQLDPETVKYMPTQYGRFYNHDEQKFNTTNEIIGNHRYLRALKNIPANTELTANYREHSEMEQPENFGSGKYASFDFDKTIATDEGLAKAKQMLRDGYNLFIVSARDKVTPDMVARARKAGIPEENIIATGSDEAKVRKVKQLGVEKHFDDKPEVIAALGLVGEQFKKGGGVNSKRYTKSLTGTNKLFVKNKLFKKKSTKRIYDPNAKYFNNGGINKLEGDIISKVLMERNRGVDFVDRAFALGDNPGTPMFNLPDDEQFGQNMSHKMAWGEDDNGQAWMYPTVMNPNDEAIQVPNQYADYISSEGYKNATGMNQHKAGGALLTKKVTCKKCGWSWDAADGGDDITTCHKCGGQGLVHAENGGDISIPTLNTMDKGGEYEKLELSNEEIQQYRDRGYVVEELPKAQNGITISDPKEYAYRKAAYEDSLKFYYYDTKPIHELNLNSINFVKQNKNKILTSSLKDKLQKEAINILNKYTYPDLKSSVKNVPNEKTTIYDIEVNAKGNPYLSKNFILTHKKPVQPINKSEGTLDPKLSVAVNLRKRGMDSSFAARKKMAEEAGIEGKYTGSEEQNIKLNEYVFANYEGKDKIEPISAVKEQPVINEQLTSIPLEQFTQEPTGQPTGQQLIVLPGQQEQWFRTPNGTPYPVQRRDQGQQYNIHTGGYQRKQGGSIGYQLGDEVDEATMKQLMNQGYIFEKIS